VVTAVAIGALYIGCSPFRPTHGSAKVTAFLFPENALLAAWGPIAKSAITPILR
jgi:hypothetical protein